MTGPLLPRPVICINNADHTALFPRLRNALRHVGASWRHALVGALLALACGEPTGPEETIIGTVRIRSVYAEGESAAALRLSVDSIHVVLTRTGSAEPIADTRQAFVDGAALSWVLELTRVSEPLFALVELRGAGHLLYTATATVAPAATTTGEVEVRDIVVRYVGPPRAMAIAFSPDSATLRARGETRAIGATALDRSGQPLAAKSFTWTSSAPGIATVDATGRVTAVSEGVAQVTASVDGLDRVATVIVAVVAAPDRSTVDATPATRPADGTSAATVLVTLYDANDNPTGASGGALTITTSRGLLSPTVDHGNGTYSATITSATPGTATIRGLINGVPIVDATTVEFTRLPSVVTTIDVAPATGSALASVGATRTFTAVARDQYGDLMPGVAFTWSSSAPAVATVDAATGVATAVANGSATISASVPGVAGVSASRTLAVQVAVAPALTAINAAPASAIANGTAAVGVTVRLFDALGTQLRTGGATVALQATRGTLSAVTDHGNGMYTAALTSTSVGASTVSATINGTPVTAQVQVSFTPIPLVLTSIDIAPANARFTSLGGTRTLAAVARDQFGAVMPAIAITWTSAAPGVATVQPVTGIVAPVANGTAAIIASSGAVADTVVFTVAQVASAALSTLSSTLSSVPADGSTTATIHVALFDSLGHAFTASGGTVALATTHGELSPVTDHATGAYTATLRSAMPGSATVSGSIDGRALSAHVSVGFTRLPSVVTTVSVLPTNTILSALGATQDFNAIARDQYGDLMAGVAFAWTSSSSAVSIDGTSGVATAVANGTATVTATAGGVSASVPVTVAQAASTTLSTLAATPFSVIADGSPITVRVTLRDARGNQLTASGGTVAIHATRGTLTPVADHGDGEYSATLSSTTVGPSVVSASVGGIALADSATVVFDPIILVATTVDLSAPVTTLDAIGATSLPTALVRDQFGAPMPGVNVTWTSSDPSVATVDAQSGAVTAVANGTITLTARVTAAPGVSSSTAVTVTQRASATLSTLVASAGALIADGATSSTITLTLRDRLGALLGADAGTVAFSSSVGDLTAASYAGAGTWTAVLTSTVVGQATVGASVNGVAVGTPLGIVITRVVPPVASVVVTPAPAALHAFGATHTYSAMAYDAEGGAIPEAALSWSTDTPGVATVNAAGVATAVANGTATVTATTANGTTGSTQLVVQQRAATVQLQAACAIATPGCVLEAFGDTLTLTGVARDSLGSVVAGATITYDTEEHALVTVSPAGVVVALGNGAATVRGHVDGVHGEYTAVVRQRVTAVGMSPIELWLPSVGSVGTVTALPSDRRGHPVDDLEATWFVADSLASFRVTGSRTVEVTGLVVGETRVFALVGGVMSKVIVKIH